MIKNVIVFLAVICQIVVNIFEYSNPDLIYLHMLDVGQGDAFLLRTIDRKYVLIDGGPSNDLIEVMSNYMPFWQDHINLVIATHGDSDHIGGLVDLSKRYRISEFIYNGESKNTLIYNELMKNIGKSSTNISIAKKGQKILVGCCMEIKILWPDSMELDDSNDRSVSIIAKYGDFEAYLAGDLGFRYEELISESIVDEIEVMKLSHHGSRTSTSSNVLENLEPEIALISAGENNKFGHPHQEVIDLLNKYKITQYRTDMHGTVSIQSDGKSYVVEVGKGN